MLVLCSELNRNYKVLILDVKSCEIRQLATLDTSQ